MCIILTHILSSQDNFSSRNARENGWFLKRAMGESFLLKHQPTRKLKLTEYPNKVMLKTTKRGNTGSLGTLFAMLERAEQREPRILD